MEGGQFVTDLTILLTTVVFLFNMMAFSGKDEDDHLARAQGALATMQARLRPSEPGERDGGANGASNGQQAGASNGAADGGIAPTATLTFVRLCTATYAVCMGCMQDAVGILRQALRDAPMLQALAEANSDPNGTARPYFYRAFVRTPDCAACVCASVRGTLCAGRVHPSHRLLLLLVLCALSGALAECDTTAARTEAEALQPTIHRLAESSGNQVDCILSRLARARCWRRGHEPDDVISVRDPHFPDHRNSVLSAFQVASEFAVPRTQLVVAALRALAPVLIETGCAFPFPSQLPLCVFPCRARH